MVGDHGVTCTEDTDYEGGGTDADADAGGADTGAAPGADGGDSPSSTDIASSLSALSSQSRGTPSGEGLSFGDSMRRRGFAYVRASEALIRACEKLAEV